MNDTQFAVILMDINRFKAINDGFGYVMGDLFLIEVAHRLVNLSFGDNVVFHLGGDEFVILIDNCENVVVSRTVEEKYEKALNRYRYIITHRVKLNQMEDTFTPEEFLDYANAILRLRSYNNSFIFEK